MVDSLLEKRIADSPSNLNHSFALRAFRPSSMNISFWDESNPQAPP